LCAHKFPAGFARFDGDDIGEACGGESFDEQRGLAIGTLGPRHPDRARRVLVRAPAAPHAKPDAGRQMCIGVARSVPADRRSTERLTSDARVVRPGPLDPNELDGGLGRRESEYRVQPAPLVAG
jgi:hypothetical protein